MLWWMFQSRLAAIRVLGVSMWEGLCRGVCWRCVHCRLLCSAHSRPLTNRLMLLAVFRWVTGNGVSLSKSENGRPFGSSALGLAVVAHEACAVRVLWSLCVGVDKY